MSGANVLDRIAFGVILLLFVVLLESYEVDQSYLVNGKVLVVF